MGKGSSKGSVQWFKKRDDGRLGCHECGAPATRWIDMERWGNRRWLSTAYCSDHGDWQFADSHHTHRTRTIKEN
jgi:hypothetical protein